MPTVSYHLRNAKASEPTPIFMLLYTDGKQTKVKTGLRIHPGQWDTPGQKAKTRGRGISSTNGQLNDDLADLGARAVEYCGQELRAGRLAVAADIWAHIKPGAQAEQVAVVIPQPLPDFEGYLAEAQTRLSVQTVKSKRITYKHLLAFSLSLPRPLAYTDFTRTFKEQFAAYLASERGMTDSTVSKQIKAVKEFLAYAADHGRTPRIEVRGWGWKHKEAEIVALTGAELAAIEGLAGLSEGQENARQIFLLMCYTGLRYSDVLRLKPEHDKGDMLQLLAKKTGGLLQVYIRKSLRPILNKYWSGELRPASIQTTRLHIKELAQLAGIDTPTEVVRYYAQTTRPVRETRPKYKLISCHTGRRTFVTLSIDRGVPVDVVMQATGHKDYKTLQRYNQTSAKRQVEVSRRLWDE